MSHDLLWPAVNLGIALVVGVVSSFWATGPVAFLIGTAAFLAGEMVRFNVWATRINDQYQRIAVIVDALKTQDNFSDLLLLYGLRQCGRVQKATVGVGRDDVWNFWRDCIARANGRWSVVTYAAASETWLLAWRQQALAIQKERLMNDCKIERVFVVDSEAEWTSLKDVVKEQMEAGIAVSWVLKEKVSRHTMASQAAARLRTMDVAVVDDSWVYETYLDTARALTGASASKDPSVVNDAKVFVREVRGLATSVAAV